MGKKTKLREAQKRAAEQAIAARLRAHTQAKTGPAFINSFAEFAPVYRERIEAYRDFALRPPEAWRCFLRVRSPEQRFLDLVRFTFADYPVPHHLENAWTDKLRVEWPDGEAPDFRRWSIIVGRGGSLYREAARPYMTKCETHHFVAAPGEIASPKRAFWYAFARAEGDDAAALRVSRSKLVRFAVTESFWKEAARFFARNPIVTHEIDDLVDFINAARRADEGFTLKGRSLAALRPRMVRWHDLLREEVSGVRWCGDSRPNAQYRTFINGRPAIWRFRQIKSSGGLVQEGQHMEHCVAAYKKDCIEGSISIWSLTREYPAGVLKRCLTIELRADGLMAQCRGFANRPPNAEEIDVLKLWAAERNLWGLSYL